jgi:hypothetical protein
LNTQIQIKALNGGLWKQFKKNGIQIYLKSETNQGLSNKNMHAMKCNLSNYSKNFNRYLGEMQYLGVTSQNSYFRM